MENKRQLKQKLDLVKSKLQVAEKADNPVLNMVDVSGIPLFRDFIKNPLNLDSYPKTIYKKSNFTKREVDFVELFLKNTPKRYMEFIIKKNKLHRFFYETNFYIREELKLKYGSRSILGIREFFDTDKKIMTAQDVILWDDIVTENNQRLRLPRNKIWYERQKKLRDEQMRIKKGINMITKWWNKCNHQ